MTYLNAERRAQGLPPLAFGAALHLGEMLWGQYRRRQPARFHRDRSRRQSRQPARRVVQAARQDRAVSGALAAED